jgi:hypothetical protein
MQGKILQVLSKAYIAHVERHTLYTMNGLSPTCRVMHPINLYLWNSMPVEDVQEPCLFVEGDPERVGKVIGVGEVLLMNAVGAT